MAAAVHSQRAVNWKSSANGFPDLHTRLSLAASGQFDFITTFLFIILVQRSTSDFFMSIIEPVNVVSYVGVGT